MDDLIIHSDKAWVNIDLCIELAKLEKFAELGLCSLCAKRARFSLTRGLGTWWLDFAKERRGSEMVYKSGDSSNSSQAIKSTCI